MAKSGKGSQRSIEKTPSGVRKLPQPVRKIIGDLSNTERVLEQHGGKVWVESRVGEGSAFYFTLPIDGGTGHGMHE